MVANEIDEIEVVGDGREDFDFFIGSWKVRNLRLRERLKGSQDWEEFEGETVCHKILGGMGNFDESVMERASGVFRGMTLRLFDPATRQWSLYWADSVNGTLGAPMVGEFTNGRGVFYDCEPFEGKRIFSRFVWQNLSPAACSWEQAFSADGGQTWETNWIMENTRIE